MKIRLSLILVFFFSFTIVRAQNFQTISDITYDFDKQGVAHVTNEISIINQVDNLYVSEYTITLSDSQAKNFTARDTKGTIKADISMDNGKTLVKLKLNDAVVGKGQINTFVFRYDNPDYAKMLGNNSEIRLPVASSKDDYLDYRVTIKVPVSYGRLSSSSPKPLNFEVQNLSTIIKYNKSVISSSGIYLLFGDYQIYQVDWQVELDNTTQSNIRQYFPLIPDTGYQKTYQKTLEPPPNNISSDADGNWLAYYNLKPGERKTVIGQTYVKVFPKSQNLTKLTNDEQKTYLASTEYWQSNNTLITNTAKTLLDVNDIYNFVVKTLEYDFNGISPDRKRHGAIFALQNPTQAVCSEYSDLFIALARSIGIPAREHEGFAFSSDSRLKELYEKTDVLHAWPEYYSQSQGKWLMADPTFGDTSGGIDYLTNFDNSHITFAVHGLNDKQPVPIGAYKNKQEENFKQIKVTVLSIPDLPNPNNLTINLENLNQSFNPIYRLKSLILGTISQGPYFSKVPQPVVFTITNTSGFPINLAIGPNDALVIENKDSLPTLLPWQSTKLTAKFTPKDTFRRYYYQGSITISGSLFNFKLPVISTLAILFYVFVFIGLLFFIVLLIKLKKSKSNISDIYNTS